MHAPIFKGFGVGDELTVEKLLNELREMSRTIVDLKILVTKYQMEADALRANVHKYRTVMENIPQKIFMKDKNFLYALCNPNYARDLQIKPEEIFGKTDYDFYAPEIAEKHVTSEKRILATGKADDFIERYIHDGQEKIVRKRKIPLKDEKENITGILGIGEEESREYQVQLEGLLAESKAELKTIKKELQPENSKRQQAKGAARRVAQGNGIFTNRGRISRDKRNLEEKCSLEKICERFSSKASKLIHFDRMTIAVPNFHDNTATLVYAAGIEIATRRAGEVFPLSNAGEEEVIKTRSALLLQRNYPEDVLRRFEVFLPYLRSGFQSVLLVPLLVNNQVVGILTFLATRQNAFSKEDLRLAEKVSNRLAEALAQAQFRSAC